MAKKKGLEEFLAFYNKSRMADLPPDVADLVRKNQLGAAAVAMDKHAKLMAENARIAKEQARVRSMADLGPQRPPPAYDPNAGPRRYYPQGTGMIVREKPRPGTTQLITIPGKSQQQASGAAKQATGVDDFLSYFGAGQLDDLPPDVADLVRQGRLGEAADAMVSQSQPASVRGMASLGPKAPPPAYKRAAAREPNFIDNLLSRVAPLSPVSMRMDRKKYLPDDFVPPDTAGDAVRQVLGYGVIPGAAIGMAARQLSDKRFLPAASDDEEDELHPQERIDRQFMEAMRNAGRR